MFTKLDRFISLRKRHLPALYTASDGDEFVIMEAREYEKLSGHKSSLLPVFSAAGEEAEAARSSLNPDERGRFPESAQSAFAEGLVSKTERNAEVDSMAARGDTKRGGREGSLGERLAAIQLEQEIAVDDLPL